MHDFKYILGVSAYYHDSAAVLIKDGEIIAAAQEERFSRKKHDPCFPESAIKYVLAEGAIDLHQLEAIVFYDKPFLKFERLLETYHAFAPRGMRSFLTAIPPWIKEKIFMRRILTNSFNKILLTGKKLPPLFFSEHHLSHSASAFFPSPFEDAAILSIDGVGEWTTTAISHGYNNHIKSLKEIHFPHSLGLLYSTVTAFCGFKVNSGEYKLMGLAPYGDPEASQTAEFEKKIRENLISIKDDGSYLLNMDYFAYATGLQMFNAKRWEKLFGIPAREAETEEIAQEYMNLALAIQHVTEDVVLLLAKTARECTGSENVCLAGGVALNCVSNGKLQQSGIFKNIWIQPAAGDAGGALGAALAYWYLCTESKRVPDQHDSMKGAYLGPAFGQDEIKQVCKRFHANFSVVENDDVLAETVADLIANGNIIGWFQGRMEYGPRALGNRSILGDPRNPEMQKRLNLKIKYREGFRPFAPSVLEEHISEYFDLEVVSPYMLLVAPVAQAIQKKVPASYEMSLWDRLYSERSILPSITHIDYSARVQSISKRTNFRYWKLAEAFRKRHGCPVLINTSFNVRGEPIVCTPQDAYICFMRTEMDYLILGNCLLKKVDQPVFGNNEHWQKEFVLD